jgi:uncharacterized membrane protein YfcA
LALVDVARMRNGRGKAAQVRPWRGTGVTLDLTFFLLAIPAVLFAGVSKGGFGSGAAFAATPILALALPPQQAAGLMLPLLMLMDLGALKAYWRQWDWHASKVLMLGSLPGIALGTVLVGVADPDVFRLLIGLIAVGFVAFQGARAVGLIRPAQRPMGHVGGGIAGVAAGFTSFISHAGGPPAAIYLLSRGLSKTAFQASTVLVFWVINAVKLPVYLALGMVSGTTVSAVLLLAPVALVGIWLGVVAHRKVPERPFFAITYVLLTVTGAKLIWDALV